VTPDQETAAVERIHANACPCQPGSFCAVRASVAMAFKAGWQAGRHQGIDESAQVARDEGRRAVADCIIDLHGDS